jgi:hypothetical protein
MDTQTEAQEPTVVVFRKWYRKEDGTGVIALFPCEDYDRGGAMCMSYEHMGQHGRADYDGVMSRTKPATPEEYAPLKRELESVPFNYNLVVRKRRPH